jgi:uncharacterized protein YfeS
VENIEIAIRHIKVGNISEKHLDMAVEALERQIPKKPIEIRFEYEDTMSCPNCGNWSIKD